jgi:hypothetical protein
MTRNGFISALFTLVAMPFIGMKKVVPSDSIRVRGDLKIKASDLYVVLKNNERR